MDYSHPPRRVARVYADRVWSSVVMGDSSSSSPASYIRMVQHLIEKCLLFHMSKEECVEALSKHANIKPVITATVVCLNCQCGLSWRRRTRSSLRRTRRTERRA
ncbi:plant-specific domain TIGR01589 family protein [Musa troglodytarum]|uniref:Plant-specific domain TIGR01589 family protein n=1 Tax=Musa troglodytarum TaxID=320322 RepID=A0A9E7KZU8_9LILI|nr:plant-specific domain TIGR01589 family protein [Musa troglodytarum]